MIRDVKEIQESTLWQQTGRQLAARGKNDDEDTRKIVVFILGEKSSGKSTVIKQLRNDFDPDTKPNSLIEYWPSRVGLDRKQLMHFYELGSAQLSAFFEQFCREGTRLYFLICIDLTQASKIISNATLFLQKIRQICGKRRSEPQDIQKRRATHADAEIIKPLPAYVSLVGTKFDQFQKMDQQSKKWINRTLRYLAISNSSSLLASSSKNNQFGLQLRTAFCDLLARNEITAKPNFKDSSKALFAAFGEEKISDLSLPSSGNMSDLQVLAKHLQSIQKCDDKGQNKKEKAVVKGSGKLAQALEKKRNELVKMLKNSSKQVKSEVQLL